MECLEGEPTSRRQAEIDVASLDKDKMLLRDERELHPALQSVVRHLKEQLRCLNVNVLRAFFNDGHEGHASHVDACAGTAVLVLKHKSVTNGGDLNIYTKDGGTETIHDDGSCVFFGGQLTHYVTKVTEGTGRWSLAMFCDPCKPGRNALQLPSSGIRMMTALPHDQRQAAHEAFLELFPQPAV